MICCFSKFLSFATSYLPGIQQFRIIPTETTLVDLFHDGDDEGYDKKEETEVWYNYDDDVDSEV